MQRVGLTPSQLLLYFLHRLLSHSSLLFCLPGHRIKRG
jgi:hypothetical protein